MNSRRSPKRLLQLHLHGRKTNEANRAALAGQAPSRAIPGGMYETSLIQLLLVVLILILVFALDREQFHLKNEDGVGTNVGAGSSFAISQFRGNEKLPLRSYRHELKGFRPPFDNSVYRECCRLATLVGAVEFLAVDERAPIVADH